MWMCSAESGAPAGRFTSIASALCAIACVLAVSVDARPQAPASDLAAVLARAGEAAAAYADHAATLIADERCAQREFEVAMEAMRTPGGTVLQPNETTLGKREWKAELVLVLTPDLAPTGYPWLEFRDLIEVDRAPRPDHARLQAMLHEPDWPAKGRQAHDESSKFNRGPGPRTFNTPAVPLLVVHPANQSRFAFTKVGEDKVEGVRTWRIEFEERRSPTIMKAVGSADAPAKGVLWVDPGTGALVRGTFRIQVGPVHSELTVTYRSQPGHATRLPFEMLEKVKTEPNQYGVEGKYSYSNFRTLDTGGRVPPPKHVERPTN